MHRGTVLFTGIMNRESEVFISKLEKEQYHVVKCKNDATLIDWLKRGSQQAILCSAQTSRPAIEKLVSQIARYAGKRNLPLILISDAEIPDYVRDNKAIGEILRLHMIPLTEAVRRVQLAIQLSQLRQSLAI